MPHKVYHTKVSKLHETTELLNNGKYLRLTKSKDFFMEGIDMIQKPMNSFVIIVFEIIKLFKISTSECNYGAPSMINRVII